MLSSRSSGGRLATLTSFLLALVLALVAGLPFSTPAGADDSRSSCQRSARRTRARAPARRRARAPRRRARHARPRLTAAQRRQIQRWHQRADRGEVRTWARLDPPPLVFRPLHQREPITLVPASDQGGFDGEDLTVAERALASREGETHPIHPRLLELVYRAVRRFDAPYVHVVSGYRSGRPTSRHGQGRAIDLVLPGVSDRRLAAFLRPQGFVGVGIYPTSGFVHLDVRARSYFWSDASGPSERNRERAILRTHTARFDAAARRRGEEAVADLESAAESETETEGGAEADSDSG